MPSSRCSRLNSARVSWRSLASRLVSGSSSSSSFGRRISARPMAMRCCSPPEAVVGLRSSVWRMRSSSAISPTRRPISARSTPASRKRIGQVRAHAQMRVEGEGLEDHRHAAPLDGSVGDVAAGEADPAGLQLLEPGDGAQRRGLAGGRLGPAGQKNSPAATVERDAVQRLDLAVALGKALEPEVGHGISGGRSRCPAPSGTRA